MHKRFPIHPPHPERNCWGCDRYCKATDMLCGNGSSRTQHPVETLGPDWADILGIASAAAPTPSAEPEAHESRPAPAGAPASRAAADLA